jgi:hypothetical protein
VTKVVDEALGILEDSGRRREITSYSRADVTSGGAKCGIIKERNGWYAGPSETSILAPASHGQKLEGDRRKLSVAQLDKVDGNRCIAPGSGVILPSAS